MKVCVYLFNDCFHSFKETFIGIWTKTLKMRTNLHQTIINRVLKSLESRGSIKAVKSVKHPTRKIYMISSLQPSVELTGGPWYTDNELDTEFVDQLKEAILRYITSCTFPKSKDKYKPLYSISKVKYPNVNKVHKWLQKSNLTQIELGPDHIASLLQVLIFDGEIERLPAFNANIDSDDESYNESESESDDSDSDSESNSDSDNERRKKKRKKSSSKSKKSSKSKSKSKSKSRSRSRSKSKRSSDSESDSQSDNSHSESDDNSDSNEDIKKRSRSKKSKKSKSSKSKKKSKVDSSDDESGSDNSGSESDNDNKKSKSKKKRSRSSKKSDSESNSNSESESDSSSDNDKKKKKSKSKSKSSKSKSSKKSSKKDESEDDKSESESDNENSNNNNNLSTNVFRAIKNVDYEDLQPVVGWTEAPCGRCPIFEFCEENGPVNASNCRYFDDWLEGQNIEDE